MKQDFYTDQQIDLNDEGAHVTEAAFIFNSILQSVFSVDWIHVVCALSLPEIDLLLVDDIMCNSGSESPLNGKGNLTTNKALHIDMSHFTANRNSLVKTCAL